MSIANNTAPRYARAGHPGEGEEIFGTAFDAKIVGRFFGFVRPYRRRLIAAVAAVILFTLSQVAIPAIIRRSIDATVAAAGARALDFALALFAVAVIVNYATSTLQEWVSARLAQRVIFDLRRAMFAHLQDISLSFMDRTHVGRLMSRLQGDVNALQEFLETSITAVGDFVLLIGIFIVLLAMNLRLGLLTMTVIPVLIVARMLWLPRVRATFQRVRETASIVNGALAENINGIRTVHESRRQSVNFTLFEEKARDNLNAQVRSAWLAQIMTPVVDTLTGVAMAIIVIAGGSAVISGSMDVGVMVAFIFYVQRFFDPIRSLSMQYTVMQRAMAAGYRIFEVLDVPVQIADKPGATPLDGADGSVAFKNVTFGYRPGMPILHDVSFRAEPGQMIGLVGPTGSGKTSIGALIHRFYDVGEGSVMVGGRDVRDVTLDSLGRVVAMVLQDPFLFTGTILENIRYGTAHATRDDVIRAAKAVRADEFIMRMPGGYDAMLSQRGRNLSIGQRQLLNFARAIVADPKVLILDEATANVDSFTERDIQIALGALLRGRTSIVIAHRLATIREADSILVLRQGRIIERGTHETLVGSGGLYAHLHASNYASFDDLPAESADFRDRAQWRT
jgi:ATP-binding cassette subfamily B protein